MRKNVFDRALEAAPGIETHSERSQNTLQTPWILPEHPEDYQKTMNTLNAQPMGLRARDLREQCFRIYITETCASIREAGDMLQPRLALDWGSSAALQFRCLGAAGVNTQSEASRVGAAEDDPSRDPA